MKKSILILMVFLMMLSGCGVSKNKEKTEKDNFLVAVSIPPEEEFVRRVCEDKAEILTLIPPGSSPETYEMSPKDIARLSESDVYFSIGVPAEEASIMPSAEDLNDVQLDEYVKQFYLDLTLDGGRDPHVWLSAKRAIAMVEKIAQSMAILDVENKDFYFKNANEYISELMATDGEIRDLIENSNTRDFIVFHPSFGYFADEYGLNMYALEKDGKEPSVAQMAQMVDFSKELGINAVFYQSESDSSRARVFAEEIGAKAVELSPLAENYKENLLSMAKTIVGANEVE